MLTQDDTTPGWDLALDGPDLATDDGLRSAVIVSLFTDARAEPDDDIPDGTDDRRGSWHDTYLPHDGDSEGSLLWLLSREKETADVLQRARTYAETALAWLIEDSVATAVQTEAEWRNDIGRGVLALYLTITLPGRTPFDDVFYLDLEAA
ncbi:phage GP46 family protein [Thiohalomonas denitrificans]|uniref:phage GP46 family protein n=1 Tax=Thiohalomonas denitrificans TaxID=415747 RepID=UPI0026F1FD45|nr:phage GP46 family protein [Thiohalomonas denitrificans]